MLSSDWRTVDIYIPCIKLVLMILLCRVELTETKNGLFIHHPSNTYHIHLVKCVLFCLKMPSGPVAWSQHCIMTALAVAHSVASRSEWKGSLVHCCCWFHLVLFGHLSLMLQRCRQINNIACILKAHYLIVMRLYKVSLVPELNHANHEYFCQHLFHDSCSWIVMVNTGKTHMARAYCWLP